MNNKEIEQKKEWQGVFVPREIWEHKELSWIEKFFWCEIKSLDNKDGCYASNRKFSETFGVSKNRCGEIIKSLVVKGFITCKFDYHPENQTIIKRTLRIIYPIPFSEENPMDSKIYKKQKESETKKKMSAAREKIMSRVFEK